MLLSAANKRSALPPYSLPLSSLNTTIEYPTFFRYRQQFFSETAALLLYNKKVTSRSSTLASVNRVKYQSLVRLGSRTKTTSTLTKQQTNVRRTVGIRLQTLQDYTIRQATQLRVRFLVIVISPFFAIVRSFRRQICPSRKYYTSILASALTTTVDEQSAVTSSSTRQGNLLCIQTSATTTSEPSVYLANKYQRSDRQYIPFVRSNSVDRRLATILGTYNTLVNV